jgi:predicted metal-dependent hydrolase
MTSDYQTIETVVGPAVLKRTARRTLAISVHPDGTLELVAPIDASEENIAVKLEKRRKWILTQRRRFTAMNANRPTPRYVTGATHRYLGRQYRLKVGIGYPLGVLLKGAYFQVTTAAGDADEVEALLKAWFRVKAKEQFEKRVLAWVPWCRKHHLPAPKLRILWMPKRWGSAGTDGRISLNPELIHATARCIDYVIVHEICHFRHPHHGPSFFRMLGSLMPDWRAVKERLERAES